MSQSASRKEQQPKPKFNWGAKDKRYLIASLILHLFVALVLFSSWEFTEPSKVKPLPSNIQARVLSQAELDQLNAKKIAEQKAAEAEAERKKAEALKRKRDEAKKEEQRRKAEAKKKAEAKRREEARKKALIQKKEEEKKAKEKKERERREQEKRRQEQLAKEKRDKDKREKEHREKERLAEEKRKLEEARIREEKRIERERRMAERLKALNESAEQQAREKQAQEILAQQNRAALAQELEEVERYKGLIYSRIVNRWHVPPKVRNQEVELQIRLLPTGELASVKITKSSGHAAFDQSALNAVQSLSRYPVPEDSRIFESNFRRFNMVFTPPEE